MDKRKSNIITTIQNRVAYISLNKAPANAYELDFLDQIFHQVKKVEKDQKVKVIVFQSTLDKFFCGGADIKVFESNSIEQNKEMVIHARKLSKFISNSHKICIAAIAGHALGGGLELAMACDIRLASSGNYYFGLPEVKLGLMPGNGGTIRLMQLIGTTRAFELLVSGDSIKAEQALEYGLINRIFTKETFQAEVQSFAEKLAQGPSKAFTEIKHFCNQSFGINLEDALELERKCVNKLYETKDAKEALNAFIEKRKPNFE